MNKRKKNENRLKDAMLPLAFTGLMIVRKFGFSEDFVITYYLSTV